MHIDSKKLNEVAALMEDHGLTRVRLSEEDGRVVELERMTAPAPEAIAVPVAAPMTAAVTPAAAPAAPAVTVPTEAPAPVAETAPAPTASNTISVEAPMVGVFYAAPSPGADPFVSVGSTVHVGDTLCIIEAMKLMNEVVAEADGTIAEAVILNQTTQCIMQLQNGDVDAVILDAPVAQYYFNLYDDIKLIDALIDPAPMAFAVAKGNDDLLEKINAGLANVKENGTYDELYAKWIEGQE